MAIPRAVILTLIMVPAIYCQALLNFCLPVNGGYRCQGVFNVTSSMQAAKVSTNVTFKALDGEYEPINPFEIELQLDQSKLAESVGDNPTGIDYPLGGLFHAGGCNPNSTITPLFDDCGNYVAAYGLPTGIVSAVDLCGISANASYYTWLCAINNKRGVIGVKPSQMGKMFVANPSSVPAYIVNITSTIDGKKETSQVSLSALPDVTKTVWVSGISFPPVDSTSVPFWIVNGSSVLVPNSRYFSSKRSFLIGKNWVSSVGVASSGADVVLSGVAGEEKYELIAHNVQFCRNVDYVCNKDYSLTVYSSSVVTSEFLTALSDNMGLMFDSSRSYLVSKKEIGNITATVGFSALFRRLPPKSKIVSFVAYSEERLVLVKVHNSGNEGSVPVKVSYVDGVIPDMHINHPAQAGEFTIPVESSRVSRVCIGVDYKDCVHITYQEKMPSSKVEKPLTESWFNKSSGMLYYFQIVFIVVICAVGALMMGYMVFRVGRYLRNRRAYTKVRVDKNG